MSCSRSSKGRRSSFKILPKRARSCSPASSSNRPGPGQLLLFTKRANLRLKDLKFDFTWFIPAIVKYRTFLGEVLVASFFLQLFALLTPLFTQVVIDKVLVHKGFTTLHVLAIGMIALALFDAILGGLRTYLFSHTTNRIDVGLGAQLFRHVLALPLAYFEARRVGDTVARVRELEHIRQFLTSHSVTVVLDLLFTVVFLAVMWFYSPILTLVVMGSLPLYALLSVVITPAIRARLHEKFNRGAENQSFLVEAISGIQTVKALAVEPPLLRKWEEQLAGYVRASFRATSVMTVAGQTATLHSKGHHRGRAVGGGLSGHRRGSDHRAIDCLQYALGTSDGTAAASRQSVAGVSTSRHLCAAVGGYPEYAAGAFLQSESDHAPPSPRTYRVRGRDLSLSP